MLSRALKGRLGHHARPEELALSVAKGRDEPFRARAFAEPALQRTDAAIPPLTAARTA